MPTTSLLESLSGNTTLPVEDMNLHMAWNHYGLFSVGTVADGKLFVPEGHMYSPPLFHNAQQLTPKHHQRRSRMEH